MDSKRGRQRDIGIERQKDMQDRKLYLKAAGSRKRPILEREEDNGE